MKEAPGDPGGFFILYNTCVKHFWGLLIVFSLSGCLSLTPVSDAASPTHQENPAAKSLNAQEQAEQAALATLLQSVKTPKNTKENYKIAPSDLIEITVFREDELNRTIRVNQDGDISFPFIGTVRVAGKSVIEAERVIVAGLSEYLKLPQVTIFVKEYSTRQIYVLGEVRNPGAFPLPSEASLTVLEAISIAGGFTPVAAQDRTRVIRTGEDGKPQNFTISVSAITKSGQRDKDMPLSPSDVVFVPQTFF
jgi:polysaccharide export outer membrane protein